MIDDIDIQKLKSDYPEFFKQLSPGLLEFILSNETSSKIAEICWRNKIKNEEIIEKIAYRITLALLDAVPKENLALILEKGVGLSPQIAEKIADDVKLSIFSQIETPDSKKTEKETKRNQSSKPSLYDYIFPKEKG